MKVKKTIELGNGHKIEFGSATWDNKAISIRNRYPTSTGGFSPRSSSEIPIEDVKLITNETIKNGYLNKVDVVDIKKTCNDRLLPKKSSFLTKLISNFEILGIIIILISFGWQQFETDSVSLSNEVDLYQTHDKLDAIWSVIIDDYYHKYPSEIKSNISSNFDYLVDSWQTWDRMLKQKETVNYQKEIAMKIRIALYILGSIFIILDKHYKKVQNMPNN